MITWIRHLLNLFSEISSFLMPTYHTFGFSYTEEIWHFGFNPNELAAYLNNYGWQIIEDLSYVELNNRYVRPTGRKLGVLKIERMVYAEKL